MSYFTSPGLSWDALLKKTGVKLELLTDIYMHLFIERGIRGGISMVSKRYAKANNPYVKEHDVGKPNTCIQYLDANNLYGWAMSKALPKGSFTWKRVMPTEKQILDKKEDVKRGWILEVDLEYPAEFHEEHNSYPLASEKKKIEKEWMSEYQRKLADELNVDMNEEKLVLTLRDKKNYVVHYRNLQLYLKLGMKLKKVHRTLEFNQERWVEPFIRMNTEFRKQAKNDFEKNVFKLMNNADFGKTKENRRKRVEGKIVRSNDMRKIRKLTANPLFAGYELFSNNLAGILSMRKEKVLFNKPVYVSMTILDNSKILMYDFYYKNLKKKCGPRCNLLYTDTDSLLMEIETGDVYKDMEGQKDLYDTSDYPKEHLLYSEVNKKVLGKMKDEMNGKPISECACLRPKMYSILTEEKKTSKRQKE